MMTLPKGVASKSYRPRVFGLALGYYSPATLDYLMGSSAEAAEFFPDGDFLTAEG